MHTKTFHVCNIYLNHNFVHFQNFYTYIRENLSQYKSQKLNFPPIKLNTIIHLIELYMNLCILNMYFRTSFLVILKLNLNLYVYMVYYINICIFHKLNKVRIYKISYLQTHINKTFPVHTPKHKMNNFQKFLFKSDFQKFTQINFHFMLNQ